MNKKQDELKVVLRALAEEMRSKQGAHATLEELIAYHGGELAAEEKKRVQDHLVWCRECVTLLLDWEAFLNAKYEDAHQPSEAEVEAAWQRMQRRLREEKLIAVPVPSWRQRFQTVFSPVRIPYAIAASLLIIGLALGGWIVSLRQENQRLAARLDEQLAERDQAIAAATGQARASRQQLEEMTHRSEQYETQVAELRQTLDTLLQPQINAPIEDLQPREVIRGEGPGKDVQSIRVPSSANFFILVLHVGDQPSHPGYALEISDRRGKLVWRGDGLQMSQFNDFTVALPSQSFPAGQYRIRLYGVRWERRQVVEEYTVRIQYQ
jgi:anti-sigma factor RsiW